MATTAKDIIQAAFAGRTANDPDVLATKIELIGVLSRKLLSLYSHASRLNPWYFVKVTNVTPDGTKWARPTDATSLLWAYGGGNAGTGASAVLGGGTDPNTHRVHIVPFRDLAAELPPRVYQMGRDFFPTGHASDPSPNANGDKLNFVHSFRHAALDLTKSWDAAENTLHSSWPEHHNDLLVLPLQRYLAIKDGRQAGELVALDAEYQAQLKVFESELDMDLQGKSTRWGQMPRQAGSAPSI